MADEDKESKTEEATEKKVQDAVERGNVPFSREAATLASLLCMAVVASFFLASGFGQLKFSLARLIDNAGGWPLENSGDATRLFEAIDEVARRVAEKFPAAYVLAEVGVEGRPGARQPAVGRPPRLAGVVGAEHPRRRDGDEDPLRVARVQQDRVQPHAAGARRPARPLLGAQPGRAHRNGQVFRRQHCRARCASG